MQPKVQWRDSTKSKFQPHHSSVTAQVFRRNIDFAIQLLELQKVKIDCGAQLLQLRHVGLRLRLFTQNKHCSFESSFVTHSLRQHEATKHIKIDDKKHVESQLGHVRWHHPVAMLSLAPSGCQSFATTPERRASGTANPTPKPQTTEQMMMMWTWTSWSRLRLWLLPWPTCWKGPWTTVCYQDDSWKHGVGVGATQPRSNIFRAQARSAVSSDIFNEKWPVNRRHRHMWWFASLFGSWWLSLGRKFWKKLVFFASISPFLISSHSPFRLLYHSVRLYLWPCVWSYVEAIIMKVTHPVIKIC